MDMFVMKKLFLVMLISGAVSLAGAEEKYIPVEELTRETGF